MTAEHLTLSGGNVLIVEDDAQTRDMITTLLACSGLGVVLYFAGAIS